MEDLRLKGFIKHEACLITSVERSDENKSASNDQINEWTLLPHSIEK